jgi:hypothetical protein
LSVRLPRIAPLVDLDSFHLVESLSMEGTAPGGSELSEQITMTIEFVAEPPALHALVASDLGEMAAYLALLGFDENLLEVYVGEGGTHMGLFGNWMYMSAEAKGRGFDIPGWSFETSETSPDLPAMPLDLPQAGFSGTYTVTQWLRQAVYEGKETYNGVATRHYVLDQDSFDPEAMPPDMAVEAASGDLYLAEEGDYVVFLDVTVEGANLPSPTGMAEHRLLEGILHYSASLTAINEPLVIEVPAEVLEAAALPRDIPVPDHAQQIVGGGLMGVMVYGFLTESSPAEVISYYQSTMPEYGWTLGAVEESSDAHRFEYHKGERAIYVEIAVDSKGGRTVLTVTGGSEGLLSIFQSA